MTKCSYCGIETPEPKGYLRKFCDSCVLDKAEIGPPSISLSVTLLKGVEGQTKTTQAEISEIKRNVCITVGSGEWRSGRRMENGRIAEKSIGV